MNGNCDCNNAPYSDKSFAQILFVFILAIALGIITFN